MVSPASGSRGVRPGSGARGRCPGIGYASSNPIALGGSSCRGARASRTRATGSARPAFGTSSMRSRNGGTRQRHHVEPVEQVRTKSARLDLRFERLVRRRHDPHVDLDGGACTDPLDLALLQHAQQLRLHLRRHVADLVEEESPAVGSLELPATLLGRSRERAGLVSEKLALDEALGHGRAVELLERPLGAGRAGMNRRRDQLLARPALSRGSTPAHSNALPARSARAAGPCERSARARLRSLPTGGEAPGSLAEAREAPGSASNESTSRSLPIGFLDEVVGSAPGGLHRHFDRRVPAHHDDGRS